MLAILNIRPTIQNPVSCFQTFPKLTHWHTNEHSFLDFFQFLNSHEFSRLAHGFRIFQIQDFDEKQDNNIPFVQYNLFAKLSPTCQKQTFCLDPTLSENIKISQNIKDDSNFYRTISDKKSLKQKDLFLFYTAFCFQNLEFRYFDASDKFSSRLTFQWI